MCLNSFSQNSRKSWFYVVPVIILSLAYNIPKFLETTIRDVEVPIVDENGMPKNNETITISVLDSTPLRTNQSYVEYYIIGAGLTVTVVFPVLLMLFVNLRIIAKIVKKSRYVWIIQQLSFHT